MKSPATQGNKGLPPLLYCLLPVSHYLYSFGIKIGRAWPLEMDHLSCGRVSFVEVKEEFVQDGMCVAIIIMNSE